MAEENKSSVIVITGDGKGKTTTALGLAAHAVGQGKIVKMVQFLKGGGYTGELISCRYFGDLFTIYQFGYGCSIADDIRSGKKVCTKCGVCFRENRNPERNYAGQAMEMAKQFAVDPSVSLLILDEISHAIRRGLIDEAAVIQLVSKRLPGISLILTGRNMPDRLISLADSATDCGSVKHPIQSRIDARRGIEY